MNADLDLKETISELLVLIRGKSSQAQLSRRLDFNTNQVHRWEKQTRQINWKEFAKLCAQQKFPLQEALSSQFHYEGAMDDSAKLVRHLIGHSSLKDFCRVVKFSPSLVSKWTHDQVTPNLNQVLLIVERLHHLELEFFDALTKPRILKSLAKSRETKAKQKSILADHPEVSAILAACALDRSHSSLEQHWNRIAQTLHLKSSFVKKMVDQLVDCDWLEPLEDSYRLRSVRLDTRGDHRLAVNSRRFWLAKAAELLEKVDDVLDPHRFAFFVIALSPEANKKAGEAYHKYISHLKEIVENDKEPKTLLRCVNVQDLWLNSK